MNAKHRRVVDLLVASFAVACREIPADLLEALAELEAMDRKHVLALAPSLVEELVERRPLVLLAVSIRRRAAVAAAAARSGRGH